MQLQYSAGSFILTSGTGNGVRSLLLQFTTKFLILAQFVEVL